MSELLYHLEVITLLIVIIWLVASIRQHLLNVPGPVESVKRKIRRAIGTEGNIYTSRQNQPLDQKLVSLDSVSPDEAARAINDYIEGKQK